MNFSEHNFKLEILRQRKLVKFGEFNSLECRTVENIKLIMENANVDKFLGVLKNIHFKFKFVIGFRIF